MTYVRNLIAKLREIIKREQGEELREALTTILYSDQGVIPSGEVLLPKYKFYTSLVRSLLRVNGLYGGELNSSLASVKRGLDSDLKFTRKLKSENKGGVVQLLSISLTTWIFITISIRTVELSPSLLVLSCLGAWQALGLVLYLYLNQALTKALLAPVDQIFYPLYYLKNMITTGVSIQELFRGVSLTYCNNNGYDLELINRRLKGLVSRIINDGIMPHQEVDDLISELWFVREERFEVLKKRGVALRFLIMGLFFVSSYFAYMLFMVQSLV